MGPTDHVRAGAPFGWGPAVGPGFYLRSRGWFASGLGACVSCAQLIELVVPDPTTI